MIQIESEKVPRMISESSYTDIYETIVEPLSISLNYEYLGETIEETIPEIPEIVFDKVRSLPNKDSFLEKKLDLLDSLDPSQISIDEYNRLLTENYNDKINYQIQIKHLCREYQNGNISYSHLCKKGEELIKGNFSIEPLFFAISGSAKKHVDAGIEKIYDNYGDNLSDREKFLLTIPSSTNFFTQRLLDTQRYLENPSERNQELLRNRYGNFLFRSEWFLNQKLNKELLHRVSEMEKCRKYDKIYFLIERKIPKARVIDHILTVDHVVDKYIQENFSFLHDIFLKMQILHPEVRISEINNHEILKNMEKESIHILLEEH